MYSFRRFVWKCFFRRKMKKNKNVVFRDGFLSQVDFSSCIFEGNNVIGKDSQIADSFIGYGSYLGSNCFFPKTKIGRFCSISNNVKVICGSHPTNDFVSTHPAFYSTRMQAGFSYVPQNRFSEYRFVDGDKYLVEIGSDVWLGEDSKIMEGVKIANGTVVAAGAIVTKDTEPYSIVAGIPAKEIRKRFSEEDICFLLNLEWWKWAPEKMENFSCYFDDIERLKSNF